LHEERNCAEPDAFCGLHRLCAWGILQRRDYVHVLSGCLQYFTARCDDIDIRTGLKNGVGQRRYFGDDMLAAIENQQQTAPLQRCTEVLGSWLDGGLPRTQCRGDCARYQAAIADLRQVDKTDAVRELSAQGDRGVHRDARLADAAASGKGHEMRNTHQVDYFGNHGVAPDERSGRKRDITGSGFRGRHRVDARYVW
jgi:hypothetical protein